MADAEKRPDRLRILSFALIPSLISILTSCFYIGQDTTKDIIERPAGQWSSRDCLTIVLDAMRTNFLDRSSPNIKVIATAYTPWVVTALNRMSTARLHWTETASAEELDQGLLAMSGLYHERASNRFVDSHGNFLHCPEQIDSLMFLVTIRNNSWPCNVPMVTSGTTSIPLMRPVDWPCYIPDITDLGERVVLQNDNGMSLRPKYVWGRKNNVLTVEETLLVMFPLRRNGQHLFAGAKSFHLKITGFDAPISIRFSVANLFPHPANEAAAAETVR